ncbi:MAG: AAA family ATPase [Planctomycetia bacterium]|nr:AAA family ATPase [Planctomycetia bacterium]
MLKRIHITGYKSFADATVEFDRLSVVVGPNGAGKSNLIDLLDLLSRLVSRESVREAFHAHRGSPIECFHAPAGVRRRSSVNSSGRLSLSVECDLELSQSVVAGVNETLHAREAVQGSGAAYTRVTERFLRYRLSIAYDMRTGDLYVDDERLEALKRDGTPKSREARPPFIEKKSTDDGKHRFVARVERQSHPRFFETGRQRTLLSELSDPVYHPHVVAAAREIASWRVYYVEPSRMRERVGVQSADDPGKQGELLPAFYYALQQKRKATFRAIVQNLRELISGLHDLRVDIDDGVLEIVAVHANGAEYPARLLSEGTLRLLCLVGIAVAPNPPALVVYEEPENGVNPARLDLIVDIVKAASLDRDDGPQFLLTTHSPLVCKLLPERLIACQWTAALGTKFTPLRLDRFGLYFEDELGAVLDELTSPRDSPR